ncbi:hypothetical protein V6N13_119062 [Hibiscus sabdariffa]|uniref:Uncharacterized protein n=1 Tax=Hibiscus sabdariffa TaxID=183260 RepID=A0ABR2E040_9ROSI
MNGEQIEETRTRAFSPCFLFSQGDAASWVSKGTKAKGGLYRAAAFSRISALAYHDKGTEHDKPFFEFTGAETWVPLTKARPTAVLTLLKDDNNI